jgi:ribosomal protein S18 acetylase RimI-like enzyme
MPNGDTTSYAMERTMRDLQLRDARHTDRDSIRDVTISAYGDYANQWFWDLYRQNILETLARRDPAEQIVAEHDGHIVGAVLLYPAGTMFSFPNGETVQLEHPEVRLLAVAPTARGQGVGKALMQECIRRARQSSWPAITLHTGDFMQAAVHLYERLGFVRAPDLDSEPAPGINIKGYRLALEGYTA